MSVRDRDDIVTIWNTRSDLAEQSTIMEKVQELVPSVTFTANFYKGNQYFIFIITLNLISKLTGVTTLCP